MVLLFGRVCDIKLIIDIGGFKMKSIILLIILTFLTFPAFAIVCADNDINPAVDMYGYDVTTGEPANPCSYVGDNL